VPEVSFTETLRTVLGALVQKGIILELVMRDGGPAEEVYFLNTAANKQAIEKIRSGEMALPGLEKRAPAAVITEEPSDIFTLYEQNIGMLTPLIADELREAGKQYPESWIKEAIKGAVLQNRRNWRYIARILEHWSAEGKDDGTHRGNLKKNTDPDKTSKQIINMVQR
jgi:DnaD/phage-associated family protein